MEENSREGENTAETKFAESLVTSLQPNTSHSKNSVDLYQMDFHSQWPSPNWGRKGRKKCLNKFPHCTIKKFTNEQMSNFRKNNPISSFEVVTETTTPSLPSWQFLLKGKFGNDWETYRISSCFPWLPGILLCVFSHWMLGSYAGRRRLNVWIQLQEHKK